MDSNTRNGQALLVIQQMLMNIAYMCAMFISLLQLLNKSNNNNRHNLVRANSVNRVQAQLDNLDRLINGGDITCIEQLRMNRHTFGILCGLLRTVGRLVDSRYVTVEEQVAMFLHVLAHPVKNRVIKLRFLRSGETMSGHFTAVLKAVIRLQEILLRVPEPILEDCTDERWKWFKNCLGALDGTYIGVNVPDIDKPRYRTRKGEIATNVLGVCSMDMKFIYVLPGWEGSAADSRVLRDAVTRRNCLRVPTGYYYLVDAGYTNEQGFLAPYRCQRYHLSLWKDGPAPVTPEEFFNMKHSIARNVIERCFGLLKLRWAILRSPSYFPIKTQTRIIIACCLLHNLIRREMPVDPLEDEYDNTQQTDRGMDFIDTVEASNEWSNWRQNLAVEMFNDWMASRQH
uniref:Putative nuclease HARBI1 isoform X1 n=1 Tax=Davidia involucrata TaxID=16924 RepID=A0A5B7AF72_DAVIN